MRIRTEITGMKELMVLLSKLKVKGKDRVVKQCNSASAAVFLAEARRRCPAASGLLRSSLGIITRKYRRAWISMIGPRSGFRRLVVEQASTEATPAGGRRGKIRLSRGGIRRKARIQDPLKYAHLVEFGTAPHGIKTGVNMRMIRRGLGAFGRMVGTKQKGVIITREMARKAAAAYLARKEGGGHPGSPPQPFMRPAFDAKALTAVFVWRNTAESAFSREMAG